MATELIVLGACSWLPWFYCSSLPQLWSYRVFACALSFLRCIHCGRLLCSSRDGATCARYIAHVHRLHGYPGLKAEVPTSQSRKCRLLVCGVSVLVDHCHRVLIICLEGIMN